MKISWLGTTAVALVIGSGAVVAQSQNEQKREETPRAQQTQSKDSEPGAADRKGRSALPDAKGATKEPQRGESPSDRKQQAQEPRDTKQQQTQEQQKGRDAKQPESKQSQEGRSKQDNQARDTKQPESKQPETKQSQEGQSKQNNQARDTKQPDTKQTQQDRSKQENRARDAKQPGDQKQQQGQQQPAPSTQPSTQSTQQGTQPSTQSTQQGTQPSNTTGQNRTGQTTGQTPGQTTSGQTTNPSSPTGSPTASATGQDRQRTEVFDRLRRDRSASSQNINLQVNVGQRLPPRVRVRPLPPDIVRIEPRYRGFQYTVVEDQVYIVNPRTREVVDVVREPSSGTRTTFRSESQQIVIPREQRDTFKQVARRSMTTSQTSGALSGSSPSGSSASLSDQSCLTLQPVPEELVRSNSELSQYRYLMIGEQIILVDPRQQKVVEVID